MTFALESISQTDALPSAATKLFANVACDLYASRPWFECSIAHAIPAGGAPLFLLAGDADNPVMLWPMILGARGRTLTSLTTPYTTLFAPLVAAGTDASSLADAGEAFGRFCRRWGSVRLEALDGEAAWLAAWHNGIQRAGLRTLRFAHFGNWREALAGRDFAQYLADRPGALRETVRRKLRRFEKQGAFSLIRTSDDLADAITIYEEVYARSWKPREPFPRFNPALMEMTASVGILRLGILRGEDRPLAVQFWVVHGGTAAVLKLAHDEQARALSPGTVLTAWMIRTLMENDGITALDFGRGDDPYKQLWAGTRKQRIGMLLINPRRPAGLFELARASGGNMRRRLRGG